METEMADVAVEDLRLVLEEEEWKPYGDGVRMVGEGYDYCIALPIPSVKHAKDEGKAEAVTQQQVQLLKDVRSQGLECKVIKSRDDDEYFVLIRASESLLDKAAEKMHNQYKVKPLRVLNKDDGSEYELNNMFLEYSLDKADMFENGGEHRRVPDAPVTSNMRASVRRQQIILALMKEDQPIGKELDFEKLRKKGVVNSIFPLHDEPCRRWLMENWATMKPGKPGVGRAWNFCIAKQPLDEIRNYYGEKVAMYFAWLGFYTQWLFFATVVSVCFGLFQMYVIYAEVTDDRVTPFYCLFLAVWATFYLEFWKRKCAALSHRWGVSDYSARETPRPEFVGVMKFNPYSGRDEEVNKKTWIVKILAGIPAVFLIIAVVLAAAISLLIYRFVIKYAFAGDTDTISYLVDGNSSATTCLPPHSYHNDTGACWATIEFVNYKKDGVCTGFCFLWEKASTGVLSAVLMMTMSMVYKRVAYFLNNWENHRLDSEYDNHLVAKTFIFQFINSYITLFWFAFRNSVQLCTNNFNEHLKIPCTEERTVDCSVANGTVALVREYDLIEREYQTNAYPIASNSCLQNLSLQLAIVFILKQALNNFMELGVPAIKRKVKTMLETRKLRKEAQAKAGNGGDEEVVRAAEQEVAELSSVGVQSKMGDYRTFEDYNEIIVQFGYVTLFAAAFPLASALAWVNNIFEVRVDSFKLTREEKRPHFQRAASPGTWQGIMELMTIIAVITNVLLLGVTTDSLPMLLNIAADLSESTFTEAALFQEFYYGLWAMVVLEHLLFLLKYIIGILVPDVPKWVRNEKIGFDLWVQKKAQEEANARQVSSSSTGEVRVQATRADELDLDNVPPEASLAQ